MFQITESRNEELTRTQICRKCLRMLPITEFYRDIRYKGGYQLRCRDCKKEQRVRSANKINGKRKNRRAKLSEIRKGLPVDRVRTCGFYNPAEKVVFHEEDLRNVCNLWAHIIETAREDKADWFFTQEDGVFAWLKSYMI